MLIVVLVFGLMPRQTHPCHGSGPRTIDGVAEQDEDRARSKQGMKPNKTEGLPHLKEENEKIDSKSSELTIHEEERILRFMEEQELKLESGGSIIISMPIRHF